MSQAGPIVSGDLLALKCNTRLQQPPIAQDDSLCIMEN